MNAWILAVALLAATQAHAQEMLTCSFELLDSSDKQATPTLARARFGSDAVTEIELTTGGVTRTSVLTPLRPGVSTRTALVELPDHVWFATFNLAVIRDDGAIQVNTWVRASRAPTLERQVSFLLRC